MSEGFSFDSVIFLIYTEKNQKGGDSLNEKALHGRIGADFAVCSGNDSLRGVAEQKWRKSNRGAHGKSHNPVAGRKSSSSRNKPDVCP